MTDESPNPSARGAAPVASEPISATPPPVPSDHGRFAPPAKGPDPLIGKVLNDRVRIVRPIARGGMGQVYLGEQTRMKRRCAVKVLDPRFGSATDAIDFNRRFLLEASVAAKVSHPNVVTIFDYGESPEGCFIAMEYLEGRSVSEEIARSGPIPPLRAIHIVQQIARALREAHALGVVHRDVKPANVFLVKQDDDDDFVKVLDFGLVYESKPSDVRDAGADVIMGSPRYMAPEQVQGKEVDARADVYSLGAVFYAMLTGHPPFERRTDLATMMAHVSDPVPPMQTVAPGLVLPEGLEAVVLQCLAKQPEARFASMEELVAALQVRDLPMDAPVAPAAPLGPLLSQAAPVGPVPTPSERLRRTNKRRSRKGSTTPLMLALIGAAVAFVGVVVIGRMPASPAVAAAAPAAMTVTAPLTGAVVASAAPKPVPTATLHVETDPPGAKVNEEGETMCTATPCDVVYTGPGADPAAEHLLAFLLPGYKLERKVAHASGAPLSVKLTKAK